MVLARDVLGAKMLLHRHRIVGAALDGGIVGDDDAFAVADAPDPGDQARGMRVPAVEAVGRKRRELEKRRAGVDEEIDPLACKELAARNVTGARLLAAALGRGG